MAIYTQETHFPCPACGNPGPENFEEKTVVTIRRVGNENLEETGRRNILTCRKCGAELEKKVVSRKAVTK